MRLSEWEVPDTARPARTWTLTLPHGVPLNLNERLHWAVKARRTRELKDSTTVLARSARIPSCRRVHVALHYRPKDNRRRDADNLVPTLKACTDGLVVAKVVPDDTPNYVTQDMPIIHAAIAGKAAAMWLVVEERR